MPEITTLPPTPPTPSTPFDLLLPRSEPGADDRFARRLASASEGSEQRSALEPKVKPNAAKKVEPVVADETAVEAAEEEQSTEEISAQESANIVAQEAAAAAAVIVVAPVESAVPLAVEPELVIAAEVAPTPPEAPPVPSEPTSDAAFDEVLAVTKAHETDESEVERAAAPSGETEPTTIAEVIVAPVASVTPTFTATEQRAQAESSAQQPATQPPEDTSPRASRVSAPTEENAEDPAKDDITEESAEVASEVERIESADEQLTANDLTSERPEQSERPANEQRVEARAESPAPTPSPREVEPQRTIDRVPVGTAASAKQSSAAAGPVINAQRFVSRVSRAFESARDNGGSIHLRLSPPELGEMALRLSLNDGVLTAQIETDTQTARNALLDNLPALRERLAQQEIRIDKFEVDVRQQGSGSNSRESYTGERSPGEQPSDSRRPRREAPTETARPQRRSAAPTLAANGRINYVA